jgi:hypothetical protein
MELTGLYARGAVVDSTLDQVPRGQAVMDCSMVRETRANPSEHKPREKSRCVLRGDMQDPLPRASETYCPTPSSDAVRMHHALLVLEPRDEDGEPWVLRQVDIKQAFLQSHKLAPEKRQWARPPKGHRRDPQHVWRVDVAMYGLGVASREWFDTVMPFLLLHGWEQIGDEECFLQLRQDGKIVMRMTMHIDDFQITAKNDVIASAWIKTLLARFDGAEQKPDKYVGYQVRYDGAAGTCTLHQEDYILALLKKYQMENCNGSDTPIVPNTYMLNKDAPEVIDFKMRQAYQELVGCLIFLAAATRPEISFVVSQLAKHMANPGAVHWTSTTRVLRYLRKTSSLGITYRRDAARGGTLVGFVDSDWASDPDGRRSIGGYVFLLAGGAVSWKCRTQPCVAMSTAEAEFMAASTSALHAVWLKRMLMACEMLSGAPVVVFEDNEGCIAMSENLRSKTRSKHIDLRVWSLKEHVERGVLRLVSCPTEDMCADGMTKGLTPYKFAQHRDVMLGLAPHTAPSSTGRGELWERATARVLRVKLA